MENFEVFAVGTGVVISAIIVFCGSIWLLLAMVLGGRLSYFVTASVTLGFLVMMGIVWSFTDLGPVGELPEWKPVGVAEEPSDLEFGPAAQYPQGPWQAVDADDETQTTQGSELETKAAEELEAAINEGDIDNFESVEDGAVDSGQTRLLEDGGDLYGMATVEPTEDAVDAGTARGEVVVLAKFDPGNVQTPARLITAGTIVLFALHLFGLSRAERSVRRIIEAKEPAGG